MIICAIFQSVKEDISCGNIVELPQEHCEHNPLSSLNQMDQKVEKIEHKSVKTSDQNIKTKDKIIVMILTTTFLIASIVILYFSIWLWILKGTQTEG